MWHGTATPASPYPFLKPRHFGWNRPSKSFPKTESCFYVRPSINHLRDSLPMLTWGNTVIETRQITRKVPRFRVVASPVLPTPEVIASGGEGELALTPRIPLPFVGRGMLRYVDILGACDTVVQTQ